MKKFCYILLAGLAVFLLTLPIHAGGYRYLFFENFDDNSAPAWPAGWAIEDTNGGGVTWHTRDVAGFQGSACVRYLSETAPIAANDWVFTPFVNLTSGVEYTLSFKTRVTGSTTHKMDVWYGTAQNSTSMVNSVISLPAITNLDAEETSSTLTPSSSTVYSIGFNCASNPFMGALFLDDVGVSIPETELQVQLVMQKEALTGTNSYSSSEEKKGHIILNNNGTTDLLVNELFSIGDTNDPHSALSFIVKDPGGFVVSYLAKNRMGIPKDSDFTTLTPGDFANKYFDLNNGGFDFSQIGIYTIQVEYENLYPSSSGTPWRGKIISDPVNIQIQ